MKRTLIALLLLLCSGMTISAQSSLTYVDLPDCEDRCFNAMRAVSDSLYIWRENVIYEASMLTGDILSTSEYENLQFFDFAQLTRDRIILSTGTPTDIIPYVLDLETLQTTLLEHNIPDVLAPCNGVNGITFTPHLFRYDDERVLLCTWGERGSAYINIARLEDNRLVFEQRFNIGRYGNVIGYPTSWYSVVPGLNGQIYIVSAPNGIIRDYVSDELERLEYGTFGVVAFDADTQESVATIIDLPPSRPTLVEDNRLRELNMIGADEAGNIYFLEWIREENYSIVASSISKFTPDGQKLWELTGEDFDNQVFRNVVVLSENQLAISFEDNRIAIVDVDNELSVYRP